MENLERVLNDLNISFDNLFKLVESNTTKGSCSEKYMIMRSLYGFEAGFKKIINCMDCHDTSHLQSCSANIIRDYGEYDEDVYPEDFYEEYSEDIELEF